MVQWMIGSVVLVSSLLQALTATQQPGSKQGGSAAAPTTAATLPANFVLAKQPEGAKPVEAVKETAKAGEQVLIRGRIGGSVSPFVEGRAIFTLMGAGLKACSENPDDHCKTPWDYCCETPEAIAKHSATIQVVDAAGAPLRTGLKSVGGMKELSEIIVQGTVKEAKDKVMIINATGVFVVKP